MERDKAERALLDFSASKACELTAWRDFECLETVAVSYAEFQDFDAAIAAIDKAIALLKPGDKRIESCRLMRESFRGNLLSKLGLEKFLAL